MRELLSGADLVIESRKMRHCVSTYVLACDRGECSIWAMEVESEHGIQKCQTVEVTRDGQIVQCRGFGNRLPTRQEYDVLARWARKAHLTISPYVHHESG